MAHGKTVKQQKADAKKLIDGLYGRPGARWLAKQLVDLDPLNLMTVAQHPTVSYPDPRFLPRPPIPPMPADPIEAVMEVVNNPDITVTPAIAKVINDPKKMITATGEVITLTESQVRTPSGRDVIRSSGQFRSTGIPLPGKRTRKKTKTDRTMSSCLKQANAKGKLKNGKFRKGWDQSRIMTYAHKLCRKAMK